MPAPHVEYAGDAILARELAKLWPHREHESNSVKALLCGCGLHRWCALELEALAVDSEVRYCFWCSRIKIDGVLYAD
jgi:hypothetical protein